MNEKGNYSAQKKYIRTHYVRFPLDLRPEILQRFKDVCKKNQTTPTTEIKRFISLYCENDGKDVTKTGPPYG